MKPTFPARLPSEMTMIFLAAITLGLVYNHSSPLGISWTNSAPPPPATTTAMPAVASDSAPVSDSDPALHNETIVATIVPGGPEDPAQTARKLPASLAWPEVKALLAKGGIVLVDGRLASAYEAGHIPGAISLPLADIAGKIGAFTAQFPVNKSIVIYCASIRCPISQTEAGVLVDKYGYQDVREMPGGFAEWRVAEPAATPATGANP